jgi:uncharacterized membrane protein
MTTLYAVVGVVVLILVVFALAIYYAKRSATGEIQREQAEAEGVAKERFDAARNRARGGALGRARERLRGDGK